MTNPSLPFFNTELLKPNQTAIIFGDREFSYSDLFHAIGACVVQLRANGIKANDRVALLSPNSIEYIIALLSLWSVKAITCPLNTRLPHETLLGQLKQINAQYLLTSKDPAINSAAFPTKIIELSKLINAEKATHDSSPDNFIYNEDQNATILFTSGSCGNPKAVLHTLLNHIDSAKGSNDLIPIAGGDQWLLSLPLYHVGGLSILFRTIFFGGTIVLPKPNENISTAIKAHSLTHISLVSTQLIRLLNDKDLYLKLKNFKVILVGGGAIPQSVLDRSLAMGLPLYVTYGSTELASQIATAKYPSPVKSLSNRKIKITQEGEILANGKTLLSGYVNGKAIDLPLTSDGWFATGDLGFIDQEGGLIITGRKDNMFISGGENIHPEEIERSLCQVDSIEQAVVIPIQNDEFGTRPVAFIKTRQDAPIKREELQRHLESKLPKYKIPEKFYTWPANSPTKNFKIDRQYLTVKAQEENTSLKTID